MSREEIFKCDSCGAQKGDTNHWFLIVPPPKEATSNDKAVQIIRFANAMLLLPFNVDDAFKAGVEHYCGAACVQKRVAVFLDEKR